MMMCCVSACSKWSTSPTLSVQELTGTRGPASAGQSARGEAGAFQVKILSAFDQDARIISQEPVPSGLVRVVWFIRTLAGEPCLTIAHTSGKLDYNKK